MPLIFLGKYNTPVLKSLLRLVAFRGKLATFREISDGHEITIPPFFLEHGLFFLGLSGDGRYQVLFRRRYNSGLNF